METPLPVACRPAEYHEGQGGYDLKQPALTSALPAEHDLIGNRITMKAILLTWFKAVDVAVRMIGLLNTLPHKSAW